VTESNVSRLLLRRCVVASSSLPLVWKSGDRVGQQGESLRALVTPDMSVHFHGDAWIAMAERFAGRLQVSCRGYVAHPARLGAIYARTARALMVRPHVLSAVLAAALIGWYSHTQP